MLSNKRRVSFIAFCAVVGLLAASAVQAKPKPHPGHKAEIHGAISAVDAVAVPPTVTITSGASSVTLNVTASTVIHVGDAAGTIAALAAGMTAEAQYDTAANDAIRIDVESDASEAKARGVVLSVDTTTNQVGIDTDANGSVDLTVTADADTDLRIGHTALGLDQLGMLNGLAVEVEYNSTTFLASEIKAGDDDADEERGVSDDVDTTARTISVHAGTGPSFVYSVPDGTEIKIAGRSATLADLRVGDQVSVRYVLNGAGARVALRINVVQAKPQNVSGTLTATGADTLTVTPRRGGTAVTLTVNSTTELRVNGKTAAIADLAAALAAGKTVTISAQYVVRDTTNLATRIRANVRGRRH